VVNDNYEISEAADEQGQCAVSISFTRAGVSIARRQREAARQGDQSDALPLASVQLENAVTNLQAVAIDNFDTKLKGRLSINALMAVFGRIKGTLLGIMGRIQGAKTILNGITNEILGIMNLINREIHDPREYAQALFNAGMSIVGGIFEIKNTSMLYGEESSLTYIEGRAKVAGSIAAGFRELPAPDNEKNVLLLFLSDATYTLSEEAATVSEEATIRASEDLYRTMAFLVSAQLIANMDSLTYKKASGYWRLLKKLEKSINQEDPSVYAAVQDVHTALSQELLGRELSREMTKRFSIAAPLLYLAHYLGCDENKIRELNSVADSFVVEGAVIYV